MQELQHTLKHLPSNKSPVWDGIPFEFWAQLPPRIQRHLLTDINMILNTRQIPSTLSHTLIKPLPNSSKSLVQDKYHLLLPDISSVHHHENNWETTQKPLPILAAG
jgi:hypothetical protein